MTCCLDISQEGLAGTLLHGGPLAKQRSLPGHQHAPAYACVVGSSSRPVHIIQPPLFITPSGWHFHYPILPWGPGAPHPLDTIRPVSHGAWLVTQSPSGAPMWPCMHAVSFFPRLRCDSYMAVQRQGPCVRPSP